MSKNESFMEVPSSERGNRAASIMQSERGEVALMNEPKPTSQQSEALV